jgi:transmembrane protein 17
MMSPQPPGKPSPPHKNPRSTSTLKRLSSLRKSFNDSFGPSKSRSRSARQLQPISTEITSSVNFQMMMYFHAYFFAAFFVLSIFTSMWRVQWHQLELWQEALHYLIFAIWSIAEAGRLYLGFVGNLAEKVPHMVGFMLISVFPQLLLMVYFQILQPNPTPLDTALLQLQWTFYVAELLWGYKTVRKLLRLQSAKYYLHFNKDGQLVTDQS